jgi:indole-3-glycerol phosphate synthase
MIQNSSGTILDEIAAKTRLRVARAKENAPFDLVRSKAFDLVAKQRIDGEAVLPASPFEKALAAPGLSFICEVKKASPSKGIIAESFPYLEIAKEYEAAGASAISVLTEPEYFLGSDRYLQEIAAEVNIPVLRKDFIVDPYQICEAKLLGAHAVLLIAALLNAEALAAYIKTASELGLSALVEIHSEAEAEQAPEAGARIVGINNRDLKTFNVDTGVTARLKKRIPAGITTVAESGIKSADDVRAMKEIGVDAVLIGESLMRSADKKQFLAELKAAANGSFN